MQIPTDKAFTMDYQTITSCRVCGTESLENLLFLGNQPLANSLKDTRDYEEKRYPLTLAYCPQCSLVQIRETIDKAVLFSHYVWVSGTSSTTRAFASEFFENTQRLMPLQKEDLVVEVASNDGTFLKPYIDAGFGAVGVEPATNIAEIANKCGLKTHNAFWNRETAKHIIDEFGVAKLIFARNVIPHVSELHEVIAGIKDCLDPRGIGAVEFHYAGNIFNQLQYDSIYHEHLCYFGVRSFVALLKQFDLFPFHIDLSPISGGAYVVYFSPEQRETTETFRALEQKEQQAGIQTLESWQMFANKCVEHRNASQELVASIAGKKVVGFGASARSSTYLNFCDFSHDQICAIIDNNSLKHGKFSAGSSIPIVSFETGLNLQPDVIFILAWNFQDEIIKSCRAHGYTGDFIAPFPDVPRIIEA